MLIFRWSHCSSAGGSPPKEVLAILLEALDSLSTAAASDNASVVEAYALFTHKCVALSVSLGVLP